MKEFLCNLLQCNKEYKEKLKQCRNEFILKSQEIWNWQKKAEELHKTIKIKEKTIKALLKGEEKMDPNERYWNEKYPKVKRYYNGFHDSKGKCYSIDIRVYLTAKDQRILDLGKILMASTCNETMLSIQKWVIKNIKYTPDKTQYGVDEYWAFPFQTLMNKKGDCDDGAILMYTLGESAGIPYWRMRCAAADVYDPRGESVGGHAFLTYLPDEELFKAPKQQDWKAVDWCFHASTQPFKNRPNYKSEIIYGQGKVWFSWNSKYVYAKGTKMLKNMKEVKK